MTRIMYWNVQDFGENRFFSNSRRRQSRATDMTMAQSATERRNILVTTVQAVQPDIFALVECRFGNGIGAAATGQAATDNSAIRLLTELRNNVDASYQLVPPVKLGTGAVGASRAECVAVFYKTQTVAAGGAVTNRYFAGPWIWPGDPGPAALPGAGVAGAAYGGIWANALLPAGVPGPGPGPVRTIPGGAGGAPIMAGTNENVLAGQFQFIGQPPGGGAAGPAAPVGFPGLNDKAPLRTDFLEQAPGGAWTVMRLFSFHAPSNQAHGIMAPSVLGTAALAQIQELQGLPAATRAVIVGDFNVSLFAAVANAAYTPLTGFAPGGLAYHQLLAIPAGAAPNPTQQMYLKTHLGHLSGAGNVGNAWNPASPGAPAGLTGFPGYQYLDGVGVNGRFDAIDNAFVDPGGALANATIVNRVVGSPYNVAGAPAVPAGYPPGHYAVAQFPGGLVVPGAAPGNPVALPNPPANPNGGWNYLNAGLFNVAVQSFFRSWDGAGRIRETSDHMALVFDV